MSILVVDDDKAIVKMISDFLTINGLTSVCAYTSEAALIRLDDSIDLILLDINMNGTNGIELCKELRLRTNIPIIFLTANSTQYTKLLGFGVGADDYITKPFDPVELIARVQAQLRRYHQYTVHPQNPNTLVQFDNIKINKEAHHVYKNDVELNLTCTEFKLMLYFVENAGKVLTRKQILYHVWKSDLYDENIVTTNIKRLRGKLEDNAAEPRYIKSVRAIGYIFELSEG